MTEKILFSHVWEDPKIELEVIKKYNNINMLMVCSGGDTLIDILSDNTDKILLIDVIDSNRMQIALTVFKILYLYDTSKRFSYHTTLSPKNTIDQYIENYIEKMYNFKTFYNDKYNDKYKILILYLLETYKNIKWVEYLNIFVTDENINLIKNGICKQGQLETTFSELRESFAGELNFNAHFNNHILSDKFGNQAIQLTSDDNNFVTRFKNIFDEYHKNYKNCTENRFYYRAMIGREQKYIIENLIRNFSSISIDQLQKINFIHIDMSLYIKTINKPSYDIIQISNITDWLCTEENVKMFICNIYKICKQNGSMIWRSLNGSYDLVNMIESQYYDKDTADRKIQYKKDLSHFYKTVIVSNPEININQILKQDNQNIIDFETISSHPYFNKLINKYFTIEDFLHSQIPFFHAVIHWVDVLINVANKLKEQNKTDLYDLIYENINDEKGLCECSNVSHKETFLGFLQGLADKNYTRWSIPDIPFKSVTHFNNQLDKMVETKSLSYICACLGTIEYMYIDISKIIKDYVDYYKIEQSHYTLHEILDTKHSSDLFKIAESCNLLDDLSTDILNGILFGRQIFFDLYNGLLEY